MKTLLALSLAAMALSACSGCATTKVNKCTRSTTITAPVPMKVGGEPQMGLVAEEFKVEFNCSDRQVGKLATEFGHGSDQIAATRP